MDAPIKALVDPSQKKVGCALMQAAVGGDARVCHHFNASRWFLAPTKGMGFASLTRQQWRDLADLWNQERK